MSRVSDHDGIKSRNKRTSGYDVESLLAPATTAISQATTTSSKLTAKVQPFVEVRENDLMESSNPRPDNVFPKGLPNPPVYPSLGYPGFPSPYALANFQLYSLWSQAHAGLVNSWPLIANPVFTQSTTTPGPRRQVQSNASDHTNNISRSQANVKHQTTEDASLSSNSATESLLAASECHLAVLQDDDGDTPLHIAIVHKNQRLIQKLIGLISFSKMTVNTPNNLSQTALHLAVLTKQPLVVEQLMDAGADAHTQDRNGKTPVHLCAATGDMASLAKILDAKSKTKTPSLDLEIKNFDGLTALHVAVQKKHKTIVQALIQYGANINAKDGKSGHTPLHHAIDLECCEVLQLLVAKGANINKPNYSGVTPVQNANSCRNEAISKIILSQETMSMTTTTVVIKPKTTVTNVSTPLTTNAVKESEKKPETQKRRLESSPSTSKRARSEVAK